MTLQAPHLHKLLLVGTARAPFGADALPPELAALVGSAADDATATPERSLWLATGAQNLWQRAGYLPPPAGAQPPTPSATEQLAACPPAAEAILRRLLQESLPAPLLQEWLTLLSTQPARLPARFLPNLLELATRQTRLRPLVRPLLGMRGQWLAGLESGWSWASETHDTARLHAMWHDGSLEQRLAALQAWRREDPAAARAALEASWASEPPEQRIAFIESLTNHLDAGDEAFLEAALDDRRKGVRVAAQRLLARLPGSALSQRMLARMAPLLRYDQHGNRLLVTLPAECDAAMARDGVGEGKYPGLGEKAGWLADMLGTIAPSHWSTQFGLAPSECLALAAATDHQQALLLGWTAGLHLHLASHANSATPALPAWLAARTRIWLAADGTIRYQHADAIAGAYTALPPPAMHALLLDLVNAGAATWAGSELPLAELLHRLADAASARWPAALSQAIATRLLGALPGLPSQQWTFRALLPVLATVLDPAAVLALPPQAPVPGDDAQGWQGPVDQFFHVVRFRHAMISSFQEPA
jgi:hypothetical protein